MGPEQILSRYKELAQTSELIRLLNRDERSVLHLGGLAGSAAAFLVAGCISETSRSFICMLPDMESAAYFFNDLQQIGRGSLTAFFPSSYKRSFQYRQPDNANIVQRTELLNGLNGKNPPRIIVSYPEALVEKVINKKSLEEHVFRIRKGDGLSVSFLVEFLDEYLFEEVDFVYEPGQYSVRGSILDVFSFSAKNPFRIDFLGNEIDSIRSFDIENQISLKILEEVTLVPDTRKISGTADQISSGRVSLAEYVPDDTIFWIQNGSFTRDRMDEICRKRAIDKETGEEMQESIMAEESLYTGQEFVGLLKGKTLLETGQNKLFSPSHKLIFNTSPQPAFNKNFELLAEILRENESNNLSNFILSDNSKQTERLIAIFEDTDAKVHFEALGFSIHAGFTDLDLGCCFYTDHQIFDRYHRYQVNEDFSRKESLAIRDLTGLHPGDYVVHIDHGIGRFGGLEKIELDGRQQEAVKLVYRDQDILYVGIHALHRISKYKGKDGSPPKIYKLGTGTWQKLKSTTKKKVKDIARELIELYARRKQQEGFRFSPDSYLQNELEASFMYEDTQDQLKATRDVKKGMEAPHPMDCLVCGDVGFGKTEVAIRAAFKAIADNKQVCVLVPTTILALQHYKTFRERLGNFPANIDYISRLKKVSGQKISLKDLSEGKTDIIIGTHRLVGKDVVFKDLGLLIIDEEQKFGVAVKEKLRSLKLNVDTLTLSATPIPRTLQLSLMGARDLSIIRTPPPNRYPIVTELHSLHDEIIREAIYHEVNRSGQVFFIHNRIQNIGEIEALVNRLCPDVKTVVAHGQMDGQKLEKIMLGFIEGEYDVLIATSIIESGLDIPNANTIIINNAQHFGLSDLHQLRGRVGRSNRKAFCYLLAPPLSVLTQEARRRLKALEEFSELGSGFNIAMQDLDIRGSGNLLGAEQSGFIAEIGFETYHRILDEALLELKETEYKELYREDEKPDQSRLINKYVADCQIDTDMELLFPDSYIENISERLRLYRILDNIQDEERLSSFNRELEDRFGEVPGQTAQLLDVMRLRWKAIELGFEKIILKKNRMIIHFVSNKESGYYGSDTFKTILNFVQRKGRTFNMKEQNEKLVLSTANVTSVSRAIEILSEIG